MVALNGVDWQMVELLVPFIKFPAEYLALGPGQEKVLHLKRAQRDC